MKRIVIFFVILMAFLSFGGCGNPADSSRETTGSLVSTEPPQTASLENHSSGPTVESLSDPTVTTEPIETTVMTEPPEEPTATIIAEETCSHEFNVTENVEATCEQPGRIVSVCALCGVEKREDIPALGHKWQSDRTVAPTCTEQGYTEYKCSLCNTTVMKDYVNALGHNWTLKQTVNTTCTDQGYDLYECSRCHTTEKQNIKNALGHSWSAWTQTTAPTCTQNGVETRTCGRCGKAETRNVSKLGHNWSLKQTVAPTCTEKGYDLYECSRCHSSDKRNYKNALGHNWSAWTTVTAPTCQQAGFEKRTCSRCGKTETQTIPKNDHNWEFQKTVAPTCTEGGYDLYKCSYCGAEKHENEKAAMGHDMKKTSHVTPTQSSEGYDLYTCSHCGATEKRNVHTKLFNMDAAMAAANQWLVSKGMVIDYSNTPSNSSYSFPATYTHKFLLNNGGDSKLKQRALDEAEWTYNTLVAVYGDIIIGGRVRCYIVWEEETDTYVIYLLW